MKNFKLSYVYALALLVIASACKKEEEIPRGEFATGVIVVNEGNYSDADGTIGFFDPNASISMQDIYQKANDETVSGYFGSIYFHDDKAYILDQVGNKIVVVEAETFEYVATINSGLDVPRYMTVANGKGYVSNWGPYDANWQTPDSYIAVIDLTTYAVSNTINTENGIEGMITIDNKVYAAASGSNTVQVIDSEKDEIVNGFETPFGPRLFAEDANGRLWVLCNDYVTSNLVKIDLSNQTISASFEIAGGAKSIDVNGSGDKIYYLSAPWGAPTAIYAVDNSTTFAPQEPIMSGESFYGFGVDPTDEIIYVGISNPTANGTVVRYNTDGTELDNFPSGRFPNGFKFRK